MMVELFPQLKPKDRGLANPLSFPASFVLNPLTYPLKKDHRDPDHEQGLQKMHHICRQRHTRSKLFQKRPPFNFNDVLRRRFTEFFFFFCLRSVFLWGRSHVTKSDGKSVIGQFQHHFTHGIDLIEPTQSEPVLKRIEEVDYVEDRVSSHPRSILLRPVLVPIIAA